MSIVGTRIICCTLQFVELYIFISIIIINCVKWSSN